MRKLALCAVLVVAPVAHAQTVQVHMEAPMRVALQEDAYRTWTTVCVAPCDRALDVRGVYQIGGRDVQRKRIDITPNNGKSITIHVDPGSRTVNILGAILTPVGAGAAISGLFIGLMGNLTTNRDPVFIGATLGGVGLAATFAGLIMLAISQTTITF